MARKKSALKKKKEPSLDKKRAEQIAEALDYAIQGHPIDDIATQMELAPEVVKALIESGLARIARQDERSELQLRIYRLNQMIASQYQSALGGDREAMRQIKQLEADREVIEKRLAPKYVGYFGTIRELTGGPGQPPHIKTAETIGLVLALAINGVPQERIALYIGISVDTLYTQYGSIMADAKEKRVAEAHNMLWNHILAGDRSLLVFMLKTQGGLYEARAPGSYPSGEDGGGAGGAPPPQEITIIGGLPDPNEKSNNSNGNGSNED